ncbi:hypothetical protein OG302_42730 [Streptomyces sp. NBC_01283]|uniref:hypothetical protein n=1 Tax=Streptomyces sp. NBC_01283 TaxID=2903812 RepID=UPI00352D7D4D|nr:hypothetical protein OG302_42730 [Streptomyces sp. NBC_01283]
MPVLHRTSASSIAAVAVGALILSIAPTAVAADEQSTAERTAAAVERIAGTKDIAGSALQSDGSLKSVTATGAGQPITVTTPATASGTISATANGATVGIGLSNAGQAKGIKSPNGTVVYPNVAKDADLAVQPTVAGGVRALITVNNADAAKEYRFDLALPAGAATEQLEDGRVLVLTGTDEDADILGSFDAPWAKDADGNAVPTSYRVQDGSLIQSIDFDKNTAFPVVADPFWSSAWRWTKCAASVVVAFFPAAKAYKAIKALGGAKATARLLWGARTKGDFIRHAKKAGKNGAVQILGIAGVQSYCFG